MTITVKNKDIRVTATILVVIAIGSIGLLMNKIPDSWIGGHKNNYEKNATQASYVLDTPSATQIVSGGLNPRLHRRQQLDAITKQLFDDSAQLIQIGHYQQALTKMHELIKANPYIAEAHANLGFIMLSLGRVTQAERSFNYALDLKPQQANAYYGLALTAEARDDLVVAISAMQTFIHMRNDDNYLAKARAAIWNWQSTPAPVAQQLVRTNDEP